MSSNLRINYDDATYLVLRKVAEALREHGIHVEFVDDGEEHEGHEVYKVQVRESSLPELLKTISSKQMDPELNQLVNEYFHDLLA